jgi:hypothetical protein
MKKLAILVFLGMFCAGIYGCGSGFMAHNSSWQSWDHLKFSWSGYRNVTADDAKKAQEQGWWGEKIPYIPAE